jgi:predicted RNase H-like HicB family nuclease
MTEQYMDFVINYYQDEDGVFTAIVPAIKGCIASGNTLEECYENAIDAIESCLEARSILGLENKLENPYQGLNIYRSNKKMVNA